MGTFKALALDPGGTTGWASFSCLVMPQLSEDATPEIAEPRWHCGQIGPEEHHQKLAHFLESSHVAETHFIYESFEFRNRARDGLELISKEYIGVTKLIGLERKIPLYAQTASMGKGFVKDQNIKALGLWSPGHKHAMDAYRHLLFWMINGKQTPHWLKMSAKSSLLPKGWK